MLSKSHARTFFLGFTTLFSGVFLALTVDTIRQFPARTNEAQMTPEVVAGKEIWEANNCMGCHTILGEGAYYAPELTKVVERRGETWIKTFIKDPEAMYPGRRRMVKYDFTDEEIDQVVAFLRWVGTIDTNGFPKEPDMNASGFMVAAAEAATPDLPAGAAPAGAGTAGNPEGAALAGALPPAPKIFTELCQSCHAVGGKGGAVGPALDGIGDRWTAERLDAWLADPQAIKPGTAMPNFHLPAETRAELVAWLTQLH